MTEAATVTTNNTPDSSQNSAPSAPANAGGKLDTSGASYGSAAEKMSARFDQAQATGAPPKMTWDQLEAINRGETAPQNPSAGGQPAANGGQRANPTGTAPQTSEQASQTSVQQGVQAQEQQPAAQQSPQHSPLTPEAIAQIVQATVAGTRAQQQPQAQNQEPTLPTYMYQMPQEILAGFRSQDPAEVGQTLSKYTQMVGQNIHHQVRQEFNNSLRQIAMSIPQIVQGAIEKDRQQRAIHDDFFGTYKDLARPEIRQMVLQTALELAQAGGHKAWNSQLRDQVAQRVYGILGKAPAQAQQPQAQPQAQAPMKQPAMMGTGARPAASAPTDGMKLTAEILDVLGNR